MDSITVRGYSIPQHIYTAVVQLWDSGIYSEPYIAGEIYRLYGYNLSSDLRFNCPDVPAPSWVSQTDYPRLFRFCISFDADCDCRRDRRIAGRENYRPVCDIERQADPRDLQLRRAIRVCENSCFCYGGPTSNWERWPDRAPPEIGPLLGENSGWVGNY